MPVLSTTSEVPATSIELVGLVLTWVTIIVGGLWWIVSGYPKLRKELHEEIARAFASGPLREDIRKLIEEEVARRTGDQTLIGDVVAAVETRMRERRVQRVRERSAVVRDGGEFFDAGKVVADTLEFVDGTPRKDGRS